MKTKEELNALKGEIETLNKKLGELNEEELEQVTGGGMNPIPGGGDFVEIGYDGLNIKDIEGLMP